MQTSRSTGEERGGWNDGELEWNTEALTEGEYEVRAVASDQPANAAGEGLEAIPMPVLRVVVDRSPPEIEIRTTADGAVEVRLASQGPRARERWPS